MSPTIKKLGKLLNKTKPYKVERTTITEPSRLEPPAPLTKIAFMSQNNEGTEKGLRKAAKLKGITYKVADEDLETAISACDVLLICADYPTPVGFGEKVKVNRARKAQKLALQLNKLTYYVGEPYPVLPGNKTPKSLGNALALSTPHHIANRFDDGLSRINDIRKRSLKVLVVGAKQLDADEVKDSYQRSKKFFRKVISAFLNPRED